ncbi:ABC transporter ATP-binding protein [Dactylosporangium matsuzakiense]|uniref:ABC transporter ATP-binding protein n=1 Tax=Dactylosporangium matsuzakiense TaxID=53360 RepID=A0A9W6KPR9_9ACTN|nr:ABC transporter ATP-binding protein [Dactylosporangium matsuzakiense]UWZ42974.1 ABC transporter ATP-binding protein [Dactylosporangium matsuzakiense]GLL03294.1 ABC transporter ATP-binding protein [Dactylosporangium matsuzakiense]
MSTVARVDGVTKRFRGVTALDGVSFELQRNGIYGLLGRNGAGKTTLMQVMTGQQVPSAGSVELFGGHPYENAAVLGEVAFIKESQRYPDNFRVRDALTAGRLLFRYWDEALARSLVRDFDIPVKRTVKKLSRGQLSALGVTLGLAARAPLTFFDEPYLGLDAVARQLFYDRLLADYAEFPRTIVLSTHLIDEVADLIEHVLLIERGRLVLDERAEALRGQVMTLTGPSTAVDTLTANTDELHRERLGNLTRATVRGRVEPGDARAAGVELQPVSLQQLVVRITAATVQKEPVP